MGLRLRLGIRLGLKPEAQGTTTLRRIGSTESLDSRREEYPADSQQEKTSGGVLGSARWIERNG